MRADWQAGRAYRADDTLSSRGRDVADVRLAALLSYNRGIYST